MRTRKSTSTIKQGINWGFVNKNDGINWGVVDKNQGVNFGQEGISF